jgi:hypothetical protein
MAMTLQSRPVCDAEIKQFNADGVVCLRGVLDAEEIETLAGGIDSIVSRLTTSAAGYDFTSLREQIFDRGEAFPSYGTATQYDLGGLSAFLRGVGASPLLDDIGPPSGAPQGRFLVDTSTWLRSKAIGRIALDSILPEIAAQLLNATKVNYCDDQIFVKEAGTKDRTAFHQDYTYFNLTGWKGCVMWVCVDHADAKAGAPLYIRGSHKWHREFKPNVFLAQTVLPGSEGDDLPDIEGHLDHYEVVQFETRPGDIIVHHFMTVHGAGGNRSSHTRRAVSLRYCGEDMRYFARPGAPPQPYHKHHLENGDRLDSEQFPVVWPRPFPGFTLAPLIEERRSLRSSR